MNTSPAGPLSERVIRDTPLGVRLLDPLDGRPIAAGLDVTACPVAPGSPPVSPSRRNPLGSEQVRRRVATANSAGVWVFPEPLGDRAAAWHLEVRDRERRFLPLRFAARVGPAGLLAPLPGLAGPAPVAAAPLFSAPGRPIPAAAAILRVHLWDPVAGGPAAWVLMGVSVGAGPATWGLADEHGQLAVFMRYPALGLAMLTGSGSDFGPGRLAEVRWDVQLQAYYAPGGAAGPRPDLADVTGQPAASLWASLADHQPLGPQALRHGVELEIRSFEIGEPARAVRVTTA